MKIHWLAGLVTEVRTKRARQGKRTRGKQARDAACLTNSFASRGREPETARDLLSTALRLHAN